MLRLAFALPLAAIAAGCGQKGPLYHPPQPGDEPNDDEPNDDEPNDDEPNDDEPNDDETSAAPAAPDSRPA